jgi:hypothetical protein
MSDRERETLPGWPQTYTMTAHQPADWARDNNKQHKYALLMADIHLRQQDLKAAGEPWVTMRKITEAEENAYAEQAGDVWDKFDPREQQAYLDMLSHYTTTPVPGYAAGDWLMKVTVPVNPMMRWFAQAGHERLRSGSTRTRPTS